MKAVRNFFYNLLVDGKRGWRPILGVYYLTYACDFRCPHCSDGAGTPYYRLSQEVLGREKIFEVLSVMRKHTDHLVITGGEPLQHPQVREVLEDAQRLKFKGLIRMAVS